MSQESSTALKTTPFYAVHKELGAKLVPFAGWNMPIQYRGVIQEHLCVRNGVGIFDVSHMGEMDIRGKESKKFLQKLVTNDIEKMSDKHQLSEKEKTLLSKLMRVLHLKEHQIGTFETPTSIA